MSPSRAALPPLPLAPAIQRYAWGDPRFIPELLGLVEDGRPCAEAWYGAHPLAPALVRLAGGSWPLDRLVAEQGAALLGEPVQARFGGLPYLLKLLAAGRPLSIQVHPNQEQAAAGFAREEGLGLSLDAPSRGYRDANHKPELLVALTSFDALCGFRPAAELAPALAALPELSALLPAYPAGAEELRTLLQAYFALPAERLQPALQRLLVRLAEEHQRAPFTPAAPAYWALEAHRQLSPAGPPDRGLLFVFLLAHVHLEPGQGMFLPAGVPHAYLRGAGIELMASSDNVLRAGLTPKHVDPDELLRVVRFDAGAPPILEAVEDEGRIEATYAIPAAEIELQRLRLDDETRLERVAWGPETLLALPADPAVRVTILTEGEPLELGRGQACLLAAGTRYRLRASGAATLYRARVPGGDQAETFRGRQPRPLAFGTSGLRGLVSDITDLEAYINTRGFLDYLVACGDAVPGTPVALAGDLRPSTDSPERSISRAVAQAIRDSGLRPVTCGRLPTPALTYYGLRQGWPSIMVTGSHIPFDRNGIKFNKSSGEVLKPDEAPILAAVERVRRLEYSRARASSPFADDGSFLPGRCQPLPPLTDQARQLYLRRYLEAFPAGALRGLSIALYEHSAVGRELLAEILRGLGAQVHPVGRSESFVAIDTEAIAADRLAQLQGLADELSARVGRIDAIVSTDGDSDRPLLLGVELDGRVRFFGGDVLGAVVADYLGVDAIAVPISASDLIDDYFLPRGVQLVRTRIGSPWVIAAMAAQRGARRVGWEANGGFMTGTTIPLGNGQLSPLPTRDAVLPLLAALHASQLTRRPAEPQQPSGRQAAGESAATPARAALIELFAALPRRYSRSGLLDAVAPEISRALLEHFSPREPGLRQVRYGGEEIRWVDQHGQQQLAEGALAGRLGALRQSLSRHFSAARGFGPLAEIDILDGLRLRFAGGDVAHVRPSGNAPQLRIYAVASSEERAEQIVSLALAEPAGLLRELAAAAAQGSYVAAIKRNIALTDALFAHGEPPAVVGTVSGSAAACRFWQQQLDLARPSFGARQAISFHEDLPVNQAFGLLLLWQRLRPQLRPGEGALVAFVFGEGSRATPLTEAESGQKPAISSFVSSGQGQERRLLSTVELALRTFAPVESYLRRSGFDGLVVKWGDEVQIPTRDLAGTNPLLAGADVVRFVSLREISADEAANKDWVGVDAAGRVTAFIPRRPLAAMAALADRGLIQRRGETLIGGVNLGSIALSRLLLDGLLEEFSAEVNDPAADRRNRPDLDPQLFTALTIAALEDAAEREHAWRLALQESAAMSKLEANLPGVLSRLRGVLERFAERHGRPARLVALDFGDQYWGDIGQHRQMYELYMALREEGPAGEISRALAGLSGERDERGNFCLGEIRLGAGVQARGSVLINARIDEGQIEDSVLIGTVCGHLQAQQAFDIQSTTLALKLEPGAGAYKVVSDQPQHVPRGERLTTVFLPDEELQLRVQESTDLRDRQGAYESPILGNPLSFSELHARVSAADPAQLEARREKRRREVWQLLDKPRGG